MPKFVVYNYPPQNGESTVPRNEMRSGDPVAVICEAARRLGDIDAWRRWAGFEPEGSGLMPIVALSESKDPGCGGVQISCTMDEPVLPLVDGISPKG
jgi:hypothetical protein